MLDHDPDKKLLSDRKALFSSLRRKIRSVPVVRAMERVPREEFVSARDRPRAYRDEPLSIGEDQTISQPYIVALITEALRLQPTDWVLELGTGSGYQAAVLAELVPDGNVVTVELVPSLAQQARETLAGLGYGNIVVEESTGSLGCPRLGPYDAIVVSAAAPTLSPTLLSQLALGGRLVVPVGSRDQQELVCALRTGEGISLRMLGPCRFVPLIGHDAFPASP
ncbi:MAG: protein-L-isoaspartate(D-aspartate) O-methyltransferase [SAR202 cluster bacterium]|nr:protein-L-isoaspartate(D-aspartate) O-methyltransferase [Dehalococcoidia bacterium]MQF92714.1 protein-L-isoaspartate(D-aspartate) O-methyltransferase [SAR202 cluster bacterium]MQG14760.1 protein-L-isoaspartate(D-aspartate) O-methyltransferase [SAR202 cluster bacterium]MQG62864.1 protein-L-isoaspartate(D-aspartate) O-methyltransferase [SAR202 cluster bacterium]MQG71452.1 protein-L-isoaspartate(D-aspartate) O-methyltransferase [SAR202 cluster bacterium]